MKFSSGWIGNKDSLSNYNAVMKRAISGFAWKIRKNFPFAGDYYLLHQKPQKSAYCQYSINLMIPARVSLREVGAIDLKPFQFRKGVRPDIFDLQLEPSPFEDVIVYLIPDLTTGTHASTHQTLWIERSVDVACAIFAEGTHQNAQIAAPKAAGTSFLQSTYRIYIPILIR